ncbi:MAG: Gfo/Idh/MocA family oxidoreductase [Verrucomicrobiota bacterium]
MASDDPYGLSPTKITDSIPAPEVEYKPPHPKNFRPKIGLIGAGGISESHLRAYRKCGWDVVAIADRTLAKAEAKRDEFHPKAKALDDHRRLLDDPEIDVVDITPHPPDRLPILREALDAGKHVLSQKPFVLNLNDGEELVNLADTKKVRLAINQNGRWAPHFSYLRNAVASGLIGEVTSIDFVLHWDQTWIKGNDAFENIHHLLLFDFAIHWFDITCCFMKDRHPERVMAAVTKFEGQSFRPPALTSAIIEYPGAQVRMAFNAHTTVGEEDTTTIVGTKGTLRARGTGLNDQSAIEVYLEEGHVTVPLEGCWFESGFEGAMGELLCAIEDDREPYHSAKNNLASLELCFAALKSADSGKPVEPGNIRSFHST